MTKDGIMVMWAVLKECSYNRDHAFTLLCMSRLLQKQGLKIACEDESLIHIENGKGGALNLDIVVPTEKGAVYACGFVHATGVALVLRLV